MHGKFYERKLILSGDDVSDYAGIRRLADCTGEDGSSGSCDVCALYRYLYQSDSDSGRAYRDDAERTVRIPEISGCDRDRAGDRECTGRRINR